jgi:hypothetical protein
MDSPLRGSPVCRSLADIAAHHKDRVGGSADMDRETHTFLPGGGGGGMPSKKRRLTRARVAEWPVADPILPVLVLTQDNAMAKSVA